VVWAGDCAGGSESELLFADRHAEVARRLFR
jgi:hypothetical protein